MELLSFMLLSARARFYCVEVAETLSGDYTVSREWGLSGRPGRRRQHWNGNLREAGQAADRWRRQAMRRGSAAERITA